MSLYTSYTRGRAQGSKHPIFRTGNVRAVGPAKFSHAICQSGGLKPWGELLAAGWDAVSDSRADAGRLDQLASGPGNLRLRGARS